MTYCIGCLTTLESKPRTPKDLRLTLLSHFEKPIVADDDAAEDLIALCESGFEREVFTVLSARGYRVIPQVKSGAYRIDMVVEGADDMRLAIELDGDEYHGPDRWAHDMARQRVLERAGWVFWRCFASTWSLRKDDVLVELIGRLTAMGIEPVGAATQIPSLVEKRVWVKKDAEDGVEDEVRSVMEAAVSAAAPAPEVAAMPETKASRYDVPTLIPESQGDLQFSPVLSVSTEDWLSKGVRFPVGTEFRGKYKGHTYTGRIEGGALALSDGNRFDSPSAAAVSITGYLVNGWIFWECKLPGKSTWQRIDTLRGQPES